MATSLLFAAGSGGERTGAVVLVVTSAAADEGKTAVSCNLAVALAERGRRVLVVDADLRRPLVHERFGVLNDRGLIQILGGGSRDAETVRGIVKTPDLFKGVGLMASGGISLNDASLIGSDAWCELVEVLRSEYEIVLIDTPPLRDLPSARIAARTADGVILTLRAGKTTRNSALKSCERLGDDEVTLTGTVLTDLDPAFSPDGPFRKGNYT